jgi:hypothetical protein
MRFEFVPFDVLGPAQLNTPNKAELFGQYELKGGGII